MGSRSRPRIIPETQDATRSAQPGTPSPHNRGVILPHGSKGLAIRNGNHSQDVFAPGALLVIIHGESPRRATDHGGTTANSVAVAVAAHPGRETGTTRDTAAEHTRARAPDTSSPPQRGAYKVRWAPLLRSAFSFRGSTCSGLTNPLFRGSTRCTHEGYECAESDKSTKKKLVNV